MTDISDPASTGRGAPQMASGPARRASAFTCATQLTLLLVVWIVTHPHLGIFHDARYYTLQALQAGSGGFSDDLFFKYGSQDRFTVFTRLYAPLVAGLGPGQAHLLAYVAGQLLWFSALAWLLRALFEPRTAVLAALGAILLDAHYASATIFQYGELFVTPRLFSEAAVLAALALLFRQRVAASAVCLTVAGLLHPLMAIPGAGVFAIWGGGTLWRRAGTARGRTALVAAAAAGLALGAVVVIKVAGGRALATFDRDWFDIVFARSAYAFLANWSVADWGQTLSTAALLVTGIAVLAPQRRMLAAVLTVSGAGLLFSFLAGDLVRNVLAVNLQLWRGLWLATVLANATLGALIARTGRGALSRELMWGALLLGFVSHFAPVNGMVRAAAVVVSLGVFWHERRAGGPLPSWARLATGLAVALCLGWGLLVAGISSATNGWGWIVGASVATVALVLLAAPLPRRPGRRLGLGVAVVLCVGALAGGDQRSDWQKFMESPGTPDDLRQATRTPGGLYWEGDPAFVWMKLRRPTFYACEQGTGAMFYRGTAMEYAAKSSVMRQLDTADFGENGQLYCPAKADPDAFGPTAAAMRRVCETYPDLDLIVLNEPAPGLPAVVWRSPAREQVVTGRGRAWIDRFYVYRCQAVRGASRLDHPSATRPFDAVSGSSGRSGRSGQATG